MAEEFHFVVESAKVVCADTRGMPELTLGRTYHVIGILIADQGEAYYILKEFPKLNFSTTRFKRERPL